MKSKGINKKAVKAHITHKQMVDQVLEDVDEVGCKMSHFVSKKCDMCLEYVYKRALINYEDKRYWLDSIYSLPYGHPWIEEVASGKSSISDVVKRLQGNDEYEYMLNAEKFDIMRKEVEQNEDKLLNISFSKLYDNIEVIDKRCKTDVTKDDLITVKNNDDAIMILNMINQEDDYEEEF